MRTNLNESIRDEENIVKQGSAQAPLIGGNNDAPIVMTQLTKHFGEFTAVDNVSLKINQGEVFCLLGHNGAGKTTVI